MKKHYFYPIWKLDELDKELETMEHNGLRLDKVSRFRTFLFVQSKPRDVQYFTTYTLMRERGMDTTEQSLKEKGANGIKVNLDGFGLAEIFRITNPISIKDKLEWRNIYLQHVVFQKVVIALFLFIISLICIALQLYFHGLESIVSFVFITLTTIISGVFSIYNFYGLLFLKKKFKAIRRG